MTSIRHRFRSTILGQMVACALLGTIDGSAQQSPGPATTLNEPVSLAQRDLEGMILVRNLTMKISRDHSASGFAEGSESSLTVQAKFGSDPKRVPFEITTLKHQAKSSEYENGNGSFDSEIDQPGNPMNRIFLPVLNRTYRFRPGDPGQPSIVESDAALGILVNLVDLAILPLRSFPEPPTEVEVGETWKSQMDKGDSVWDVTCTLKEIKKSGVALVAFQGEIHKTATGAKPSVKPEKIVGKYEFDLQKKVVTGFSQRLEEIQRTRKDGNEIDLRSVVEMTGGLVELAPIPGYRHLEPSNGK